MTQKQARVLVVDDELSVRDSLESWFLKDGHHVEVAASGKEALAALSAQSCDVVLLDIKMPGMDGMEVQERIHRIDPGIAVIMLTAFASVETAVQALKRGAFDYVTKPVDPDELSHLVQRALDQKRLQEENIKLREAIDELSGANEIIGESVAMQRVMDLVRMVAMTDATVLIRGETGTGKELVARAVHALSPRRYYPIVPVNCGAMTDTLLESELFGHEKGSFTGAQYRRRGKLELADGGTLFLDEIGNIGAKMQVDLLRVIEEKEFTRIGGNQTVKVDFRIVCATNENLENLCARGSFRSDLYYRINVFAIDVPPVRERRSDIPLLARHFLHELSVQTDRKFTDIAPAAMERLLAYDWPGNVRELANAIERAVVVGKCPLIQAGDLVLGRSEPTGANDGSLAAVEIRHIQKTLAQNDWNISRSAELLQIDRATLYSKIKKFGLTRPT